MFRLFRRASKHRRPRATYAPQLEALEDRCLLSGGLYAQTNLVADTSGVAAHTDSNLIDAWGLAIGNGQFLVANDGSNTATVYNSSGVAQQAAISTPAQPTGAVFNSAGTGFNVTQGSTSSSSQFTIWSNEATKNGI